MDERRLGGVLRDIDQARGVGADVGSRLCSACVDVLDVDGAGIMLMTQGEHHGTLGASNAVMAIVEELQFTLGEGPCIDAFETTAPVLEPDLDDPADVRWPAFTGPAVHAGVRAVFGFPLLTETDRLGTLDLYLGEPGPLDAGQIDDAVVLASVISHTVLALQAGAEPGELGTSLDASLDRRAVVHQASGMVSAQLDIDVAEALVRIRAHAYTANRPVDAVARAIVTRHLRLG